MINTKNIKLKILVSLVMHMSVQWFAAKDCSVLCSAYCVKFVFYPSPSLGRQVNILKTDLSTCINILQPGVCGLEARIEGMKVASQTIDHKQTCKS